MENVIKMIFVSKWFLIPVEYIDSKITIWPPDNISLIYSRWVTLLLNACKLQTFRKKKNISCLDLKIWEHKDIGFLNAMWKFCEIKNGQFLFISLLVKGAFYM